MPRVFPLLQTAIQEELPSGPTYSIFRPSSYFSLALNKTPTLLTPPEKWLPVLVEKLEIQDSMIPVKEHEHRSRLDRARGAYTKALISYVSATIYREEELSVVFDQAVNLDQPRRSVGMDWPYLGKDTL